MEIESKLFGKIVIDEDKIITFHNGIVGFPDLNRFMLIFDQDQKDNVSIYWLQSIDEPSYSIPVIDPLIVIEDYNPVFEDELLKSIFLDGPEDMLVFTTVTVPTDYKKMTVNLKAPIIISTNARKGCQIIIDNEEYKVRFPIYEILSAKQEGKGE